MKRFMLILFAIAAGITLHAQKVYRVPYDTTTTDSINVLKWQPCQHDTLEYIAVRDSQWVCVTDTIGYKDTIVIVHRKGHKVSQVRSIPILGQSCAWVYSYPIVLTLYPNGAKHDSLLPAKLAVQVDTTICCRDSIGTIVGVLVNIQLKDGSSATYDKASAAKDSLHVSYVREGVDLTNWKGISKILDSYRAKGLKVWVNISYRGLCASQPCSYPSATDLQAARTAFDSFLQAYGDIVDVVAGPNEPFNDHYWINPTQRADYNNFVAMLIQEGKKYGKKVIDGGMYNSDFEILAYRHFVRRGMQWKADSLRQCMTSPEYKQAINPLFDPSTEAKVQADSSTMATDVRYGAYAINLHIYEDSAKSWQHLAQLDIDLTYLDEYAIENFGLHIVCNETGVRNCGPDGYGLPNTDGALVVAEVAVFQKHKIPCFYFCGNWGSACSQGLFWDDGTMKDAGIQFQKYIDQNKL
jgi:hypothetical protein